MNFDPENHSTEEGKPESSFQMFSKFDSNDGKWAEARTTSPTHSFVPGQWIDRYLLVEKIGDGGMGEVWLAEQSEPIRREVAIKLIRPERMTDRALRRFKQECQTLAVLNHPNICSILDAGTTKDSVPFLVMQRIEGQPITHFCDQNQLSIPDRLSLFSQLCEAIQYAHQQGIYHRDIKPANVLVANIAGKPTVKVIDFGLSKASSLDWPLNSQLDLTREGEVIGTLRYLSPELAISGSESIGPAAEVYSLGIVLFELLVGRPPVSADASDSLGKYLDSVRSFESIRPSQLISESNEELDAILHRRNAKAESLIKVLKLDLDWVVLKAVKRNAALRYQSVQAMREDIDRHLAGRPVSCRHSELGYQIQKLLRRNAKKLVWFTAAVVLASLSVWVGTQLGNPKVAEAENSLAEATSKTASASPANEEFAAEPPLTSRPPLFDRQALLRNIHTAKALASTQDLSNLDWEQCQQYQRLLLENGEVLTAECYANELIRRSTASHGPDSMTTMAARQQRARCWIVGGQLTDAQDELLQLLPLVSDEPDFSAKIAMDLAVAYEQSGRLDLAIKHLSPSLQALARQNQTGSSISPTFLKCCQQLSNLHWKNGQLNLAIAWASEISQAVQSYDNVDWKFATQCDLLAYRYAKDSTPENLLAFERLLEVTAQETTHEVLLDARRASTLMQIFDRRECLVFGKAIAPVFHSCAVSRNYKDKVLLLSSNLELLPEDTGEEFSEAQLKICLSAFKRRLRSSEEALLVFDFFQSMYESSFWTRHRQQVSLLLQKQREKYAQVNSGKNAATVALNLQLELCDCDWEQLPDTTILEMHDQVVESSGRQHWLAKKLRTHPAFNASFVQTSNQH